MLICIPLAALFIDTLLPYFFSQAIGGLAEGSREIVKNNLIIAAGVGFIGVIFNATGFQTMIKHEARVRTALSNRTFKDIINKDMRFFANTKVGALTSRFIDFIRAEVTLQDLLIIRTLGFILSVSIGLVILAHQSLWIAFIIIFLITALCIQIRWSIKKRTPWRQERKQLIGDINGTIADAITNNLAVKTFANEKNEIKVVAHEQKRYQDIYIKDIGFVAREGSARQALMTIVQIIAIGMAAYLLFRGVLTVATAVFILSYLQRIASQIFMLGEMLNGYDQALLEAAPMSEILQQPVEVIDQPGVQSLKLSTPIIELCNVSYHYDDSEEDVLCHINLTVEAGQKVGLVGGSGAGKTTITHLLLRFADVTDGSILIDGQDIRSVTQESLRQNIAYVPQEPVLFHRSLRQNIAYGKPHSTEQEIYKAVKHANALEFIEKLPQGLDTIVGERGVKLSGGQRQRIAIARAILKDASILILDEATSALDSESEEMIQDALKDLMKGRTSLVIAHRLSTIAKLDRIIVLEKGQIIEDGSHAQLLAKRNVYHKLWQRQSGGFIEE
jgi:ATP-binding cassette subfamily B protein